MTPDLATLRPDDDEDELDTALDAAARGGG